MPDTHIVLLLILFCDISSGLEEGRIIKSRTTHLISLSHSRASRKTTREAEGGRMQGRTHRHTTQRAHTTRTDLPMAAATYNVRENTPVEQELASRISRSPAITRPSGSFSLFLVYFLQQESLSSTRVILHSHTLTHSHEARTSVTLSRVPSSSSSGPRLCLPSYPFLCLQPYLSCFRNLSREILPTYF